MDELALPTGKSHYEALQAQQKKTMSETTLVVFAIEVFQKSKINDLFTLTSCSIHDDQVAQGRFC